MSCRVAQRALIALGMWSILLLPGVALAVAPELIDQRVFVVPAQQKSMYMSQAATWTGSVYSLGYTIVQYPQSVTVTQNYVSSPYVFTMTTPANFTGEQFFTFFAYGGGKPPMWPDGPSRQRTTLYRSQTRSA